MSDPYADLGLDRTATDAEIQKTYRRLVKQCHPDHSKGDPEAGERFDKIQAAYDILRDGRRAAYDRGAVKRPAQPETLRKPVWRLSQAEMRELVALNEDGRRRKKAELIRQHPEERKYIEELVLPPVSKPYAGPRPKPPPPPQPRPQPVPPPPKPQPAPPKPQPVPPRRPQPVPPPPEPKAEPPGPKPAPQSKPDPVPTRPHPAPPRPQPRPVQPITYEIPLPPRPAAPPPSPAPHEAPAPPIWSPPASPAPAPPAKRRMVDRILLAVTTGGVLLLTGYIVGISKAPAPKPAPPVVQPTRVIVKPPPVRSVSTRGKGHGHGKRSRSDHEITRDANRREFEQTKTQTLPPAVTESVPQPLPYAVSTSAANYFDSASGKKY